MSERGGSVGFAPWPVNYDVLLAEESYFCLKRLLSGTATPANVFAVFFLPDKGMSPEEKCFHC